MIVWLYLAIAAGAYVLTWAFAVRESAVIFTASMSFASWTLLAVTPQLTMATGGTTVSVSTGPARYLFAALALLSAVATIGAVLGIYPEQHPESEFSEVTQ